MKHVKLKLCGAFTALLIGATVASAQTSTGCASMMCPRVINANVVATNELNQTVFINLPVQGVYVPLRVPGNSTGLSLGAFKLNNNTGQAVSYYTNLPPTNPIYVTCGMVNASKYSVTLYVRAYRSGGSYKCEMRLQ